MKKLLRIFSVLLGLSLGTVTASATIYRSTCSGDIEDGNTWGVDPKNFELHADDQLVVNHDVYICTKYMAPDVEVMSLQITATGKVLIKFSGDTYSTMRGLNVHGDLINYGCIGFERLGSFSSHHDDAVAGGYGRLFLHVGGNLYNDGIFNVNSLSMYGTNPKITSYKPIQATDLTFKDVKGKVTSSYNLGFYNTNMSGWSGSSETTQFEGLDMDNYMLTLTADPPTEPEIWWYQPGWNGCMTDMKILFGEKGGGAIYVNDCYVKNCSFEGAGNITVGCDDGKHAFFFGYNTFKGDVILSGNSEIHIANTFSREGFEIDGSLFSLGNINASFPVYPGKGLDGTDYVMKSNGDKGRITEGDIFVHGNIYCINNFGTGYQDEGNYDAHTKLHVYTLGDDITIAGNLTAEVILTQMHPADEDKYLAYGGEPFDKRGSVTVNQYLVVNRYPTKVSTTFVIDGGSFRNEALPSTEPLIVDNGDLDNEVTGIRNGLVKNKGFLTCRYNGRKDWGNMMCQHIDFPNWYRWRFDGNNSDTWQVDNYLGYLEVLECGKPDSYSLSAPRYWKLSLVSDTPFSSCLHDLTLYYEDEDVKGLDENELAVYQSMDSGKTWQQISNEENTTREPEKNRISIGKYSGSSESLVNGFGMFTIGQPGIDGINDVVVDAKASRSTPIYNIIGREVSTSYKGLVIKNGKKMIQ